ncbi:MAG: hypothetical protein ACU0BJ_16340 [Shimia sp.]|uniref:hypothetical protein n=1 Tax=Shimia sp. TaxID=1954381 RepID=UPI00405A2BC4
MPDGSVVSQYPVGHVFAALGLAGFGAWMAILSLHTLETNTSWADWSGAVFALLFVVVGLACALHCWTYRVSCQDDALSATGGIFPSHRTAPIPLADTSKRKGVDILNKSPRTYSVKFVRNRHIDLPAAMTRSKSILKVASAYYKHDFMWDTHPKEN